MFSRLTSDYILRGRFRAPFAALDAWAYRFPAYGGTAIAIPLPHFNRRAQLVSAEAGSPAFRDSPNTWYPAVVKTLRSCGRSILLTSVSGPAVKSSLPLKVYIVLLNWRGTEDTVECLESVFAQDHGNYTVIVCDNNSGDDSLDRIADWAEGRLVPPVAQVAGITTGSPPQKPIGVEVLTRADVDTGRCVPASGAPLVLIQNGDNLGFAGGNNVALRYILERGDADYVWLLNNDTVVHPGALSAMLSTAKAETRAGMVGSRLLHYAEPDRLQAAGGGSIVAWTGLTLMAGGEERDSDRWASTLELDYVTGASLLVRWELVREMGGLDERFFLYSEEVDWCVRARRLGWKLLYAPGSRVWHKGGRSVVHRSPLHDYHVVRGMLLLVQRHYPQYLPLTFAYSVYRCIMPKLMRFDLLRMRAVLRAYQDFFSNTLFSGPGAVSSARDPLIAPHCRQEAT